MMWYWYIKTIVYVVAISSMVTACELFGGKEERNGGEVVWRLANQTDKLVGTQPLIENGVVYFVQDQQLKAYRLSDGKRLWSISTENANYSRKILESGNKIFLDEGLDIQAHSKATGRVVWETDITDDAREVSGIGSPIMSQDDQYLYAVRKGYALKLRKDNGEIAGRFELDRLVPEGVTQGGKEPVISPFGDNILYIGASYFDHSQPTPAKASGGNVFALDASTGDLVWEHHIEVAVPNPYTEAPEDSLTGSPLIYDIGVTQDKVVVLAGFYIVVLNRMTGEPVWETYFSQGGFDVGLAIKGDVYAASIGRFATRVDIATGKVIWQRNIKFSNTSIPMVQNGRMYFNNSGGGGIWILNSEDGSVIYHKNTPNYERDNFDVYISSLGVGEGYMVNVGSKAVYCLRVP